MPLGDSESSKIEVIKAGMLEDTIEDIHQWTQVLSNHETQFFQNSQSFYLLINPYFSSSPLSFVCPGHKL